MRRLSRSPTISSSLRRKTLLQIVHKYSVLFYHERFTFIFALDQCIHPQSTIVENDGRVTLKARCFIFFFSLFSNIYIPPRSVQGPLAKRGLEDPRWSYFTLRQCRSSGMSISGFLDTVTRIKSSKARVDLVVSRTSSIVMIVFAPV